MRLLLDTHVLLALARKNLTVLGRGVETVVRSNDNELTVSAVSLWEIAIKHRLGKLEIAPSLEEWPGFVRNLGVDILPVFAEHVIAAVDPEPPTRDPFDRLLLAQCKIEGLRLVTIDRALTGHPYTVTE